MYRAQECVHLDIFSTKILVSFLKFAWKKIVPGKKIDQYYSNETGSLTVLNVQSWLSFLYITEKLLVYFDSKKITRNKIGTF